MSTPAIIMMVISIAIVWGGLIGALIHLTHNPDQPETDKTEP